MKLKVSFVQSCRSQNDTLGISPHLGCHTPKFSTSGPYTFETMSPCLWDNAHPYVFTGLRN
jgi:hypothetical protein